MADPLGSLQDPFCEEIVPVENLFEGGEEFHPLGQSQGFRERRFSDLPKGKSL